MHECGTGKAVKARECRTCYNDYMRVYLANRYQQRKRHSLALLGNKCVGCGSDQNLEFDHVDRTTKHKSIAKMLMGSAAALAAELAKCQLLCENCHQKKTSAEVGVPHGGGKRGKHGCACEPCRSRSAKYVRETRKFRRGIAQR